MFSTESPHALLAAMQTSAATVENSMELPVPQKIESGSALLFSNSTSGYIFQEIQNTDLKEYMYPYVHCSVIHNRQDNPSVHQ